MPEEKLSPDEFDRTLGKLIGLPGVTHTAPTTVQIITPLLGLAETFIIRTIRQQDRIEREGKDVAGPQEFTVLLEHTSREKGFTRLVIPPKVADLIARQRESLTTQARKRTAKRLARERMARGETPGFLRGKAKKRGGKKR
jgi:hypothetical protein